MYDLFLFSVRNTYLCSACHSMLGSVVAQKRLSTQIEELKKNKNPRIIYGQPSFQTHPHLIKSGEVRSNY